MINEVDFDESEDWQSIEDMYVLDVYPRRDVVFVKGKGALLYDNKGKEYIDCASNVGVSIIGHGNEEVADALREQYLRLGSCYSMFYNDVRAKLARKLISIAPNSLDKVFFCNSGSESIEAAIKFSRATTGRKKIISMMRGFHGKTMGSLSATWNVKYKEIFGPLLGGFVHVPFNNYERLESVADDDVAAIIIELVQGEGGVRPAKLDYIKKVRKLCDERNILLIIDEVQTGFCRTGSMFACENYVTPDILCLAKSIAGGVPMGAVLCNGKIKIPKKSHTSTFGGNPLACAASLATIEYIERNGLVTRAKDLGVFLLGKLRQLKSPLIREIRGLGLMVGIELKVRAAPYVNELMEKGVVALLAGPNVIRLLPSAVISKEQLNLVIDALESVLI